MDGLHDKYYEGHGLNLNHLLFSREYCRVYLPTLVYQLDMSLSIICLTGRLSTHVHLSQLDMPASTHLITLRFQTSPTPSPTLQHIWTMILQVIPQALHKLSHPVKAICTCLKGKEGHLCGNLMAKCVDFSAQTDITGGPTNLELDKVSVPRSIAMNLTYPERGEP